jgi:hypothetical protein
VSEALSADLKSSPYWAAAQKEDLEVAWRMLMQDCAQKACKNEHKLGHFSSEPILKVEHGQPQQEKKPVVETVDREPEPGEVVISIEYESRFTDPLAAPDSLSNA